MSTALSISENVRKGFRLFVRYYISALLLLGLSTIPVYRSYETNQQDLRNIRENSYLSLAKFFIATETEKILSDLLYINSLEIIDIFLRSGEAAEKKTIENLLLDFSSIYGRYDSVRILSSKGMELVRINNRNNRIEVVKESDLEDKSSRDFFQEALKSNANQVLVTAPDLNMKHGQYEKPYVPITRFLLSKYDEQGTLLGVLALNYKVESLFETLRTVLNFNVGHESIIVDHSGTVIFQEGYKTEDLLKGRQLSFKDRYPEVWAVVQQQRSGHVSTTDGMFYFSAVDNEELNTYTLPKYRPTLSEEILSLKLPGGAWNLVLFIPKDVLAGDNFFNQKIIRWIYLILLVFITPAVIFFVKYKLGQLSIKDTEEASTKEHLLLYEDAPCGYISIQPDGMISKANQTLLHWLGYQGQEFVDGRNLNDFTTKNGRVRLLEVIRHLESISFINDVSLDLIKKSGHLLPLTLSGRAFYDQQGKIAVVHLSLTDATDRRKIEKLLASQAQTDELTELNNRRAFFDKAAIEWSRTKRHDRPLSLILIDVDDFKKINDSHGHLMGDQVLKTISQAVKNTFRKDVISARYGGDEFIALLPETTLQEAEVIAERMRRSIAEEAVFAGNGDRITLSVSMGVATIGNDDATLYTLINKADEALYNAKGEGRNRVGVYGS